MIIDTLKSVYDFGYTPIENFFLNRGVEDVTFVGFYLIAGTAWLTLIIAALLILSGLSRYDEQEKRDVAGTGIGVLFLGSGITYALLYTEIYVFQTNAWILLILGMLLGTAFTYRKRWLPRFPLRRARQIPQRIAPVFTPPLKESTDMSSETDFTVTQVPPRTASTASQTTSPPRKQTAMAELDAMIGLDEVKKQVRTVAAFAKAQRLRIRAGYEAVDISQHMVFTGNPGTDKTSVARIIGRIYHEAGLLSSGEVNEVIGRDLVGEFVGQTAPKVKKIVAESIGKVLFIDEAYILVPKDSYRDYGPEAVGVLVDLMESYRDQLIVIIAGYEKEIDALLRTNPGLKSRFKNKIRFEDYAPAELTKIFEGFCQESSYALTTDARLKAQLLFAAMHDAKNAEFGNGRAARNVFEFTLMNQAARIEGKNRPTKQELLTLHSSDIPALSDIRL